jgi:hypothetical protein
MGEAADDALERYLGEHGYWGEQAAHLLPTCKRCGARDLDWIEVHNADGKSSRWVLYEGKRPHVCPIPDMFDAVPE